jgi:hypothetical protein
MAASQSALVEVWDNPEDDAAWAANYVLRKNAGLYRRLA